MVTAESADWIHDFVHLSERHTVHPLIELVKILLDVGIVHWVRFVVGFVEHGEDAVTLSEVRGMGFQAGL